MTLSGFKISRTVCLLLLGSLLLLAQCKRSEEPFNNNAGKPVFSLKGTINGLPFQWIAGVDSYYMYSSYKHDVANQVYAYTGTLQRTTCDTCKESVQITLYDKTNNNGSVPVNIVSALQAGNYQYHFQQSTQKIRYKYQFTAETNYYASPKYKWTFGTIDTSSLPNPIVYFSDTNTQNVCLTVTDNITLCSKTICNNVSAPKNIYPDYIKPNFTYDTTAIDTVQFINISHSPSASLYQWDFGDGNQVTDSAPKHSYAAPGRYKVSLTMISGPYGTQTIEKNIAFKNPSTECLANYSYSVPVADTVTTGSSILSKILIRYIDAAGEVFVSNTQAQPFTSQFTVVSNNPYDINERGDKTRSLAINFKCRVFSTTTASFKDLVITDGVIAVAYP